MSRRFQSPAAIAVFAVLLLCTFYVSQSTHNSVDAFIPLDLLPVHTAEPRATTPQDVLQHQLAEQYKHVHSLLSKTTQYQRAAAIPTSSPRPIAPIASKLINAMPHAAVHEDYGSLLSPEEKTYIQAILAKPESDNRTQKIEQLYNMNGPDDWKKLISSYGDASLPPLTKIAQKYLFNHQNPTHCHHKKFLVVSRFPNDQDYGLGATISALSMNLNIALRSNRILVYNATNAPGEHFITKPDAESSQTCGRSLDCIFEPLSRCQGIAVTNANAVFLPASKDLESVYVDTPSTSVPPVLGHALRTMYPDSTPDFIKYWWRVQATTYIMRINGATMQSIKNMRMNSAMHKGVAVDSNGLVGSIQLPFPLPESSFSMHVRHGDKTKEMRLIPFEGYIRKAERYVSENPMSTQKIAFISTEDSSVLEDARKMVEDAAADAGFKTGTDIKTRTTRNKNWTFYWTELPRINGGPEEQLQAFGDRTETTLRWLLQLMMSIEGNALIGTRNSFWSRTLDGLRCTWMGNCKGVFLEVGDEEDWLFYGN